MKRSFDEEDEKRGERLRRNGFDLEAGKGCWSPLGPRLLERYLEPPRKLSACFPPQPPTPSYSRSIMIDRTQVALCICVNLHVRLHFLLSPTSHHFSSLGFWGLPQTHILTIQRSETNMFKVQELVCLCWIKLNKCSYRYQWLTCASMTCIGL